MAHDSAIPSAIPFRTLGAVSGGTKAAIIILVVIGLAALFLAVGGEDHGRVWMALHFNWLFWSSMAMGMVMFAVALHITNGQWAWSIRRFAMGGAAFLPISFVLFLVDFFGGAEVFFHHWLHVEGDPVIDAKAAWLNLPGMAVRDILSLLVLYGLALAFVYYSVRPDVYGVKNGRHSGLYGRLTGNFRGVQEEAVHSRKMMSRLAPILGLAYAFLMGIIAIDQAMSLNPHWFSTMFPVAFFWTGFHGGVAATAIAVVLLRSRLRLQDFITVRQFHDLGKLIFAFSVFWMYLNWSQYIVIWYGLLPWEQEFFVERFNEPFGVLAQLVVICVFVIPFFGLLTRPPKKVPGILAGFAAIILFGHWIERYMLIVPSLWEGGEGDALPFGLPEIGVGLGFLGLFLAAYTWYLSRLPLLPSPATLAAQESAVVAVPAPAAAGR
jgi:hypothetical protein